MILDPQDLRARAFQIREAELDRSVRDGLPLNAEYMGAARALEELAGMLEADKAERRAEYDATMARVAQREPGPNVTVAGWTGPITTTNTAGAE